MNLWRRILVERRSLILPLAALVAVNLVVLLAVVLPLKQSVGGLHDEVFEASKGLASARAELADAQRATASKTQADQELNKFYSDVLPANFGESRQAVNFWVENTASAIGVRYKQIENTSAVEVRESQLMQVKAKFVLSGDYASIRRFLYAVEAAEEFLVVESVQLAQPGAQQTNSPNLDVELSVTTFFVGGRK